MSPMKTEKSPSTDQWSLIKELYAHRKLQKPSWIYRRIELGLPIAPEFEPYLEAYRKFKEHPHEDTFFMTNFMAPEPGPLDP